MQDAVDELLAELCEGVALRDLLPGELYSLRDSLRRMNAAALKSKHEHAWDDWHDTTSAALRRVNAEVARDRAFQRRQFVLPLENFGHA